MKKLKLILCVLLVTAIMAGCTNKNEGVNTNADAKTGELTYKKVVIGVDDAFPPMGFRDESSNLVGFDIELADAVFEKLGIEVEFQVIDWSTKETELNNKNIDIIWNGYTITEPRKELVNFSDPYLENKQCIVVMADSNIKTKADLSKKVVAVQTSSAAEEAVIADEQTKETFKELVTFSTYDECMRDLEAGRSQAVVGDEVLIKYYLSKKDGDKFYILEENFGNEEYGIGVRKEDTALLKAINDTMKQLKEDKTTKAISEKWFGEDIVK